MNKLYQLLACIGAISISYYSGYYYGYYVGKNATELNYKLKDIATKQKNNLITESQIIKSINTNENIVTQYEIRFKYINRYITILPTESQCYILKDGCYIESGITYIVESNHIKIGDNKHESN